MWNEYVNLKRKWGFFGGFFCILCLKVINLEVTLLYCLTPKILVILFLRMALPYGGYDKASKLLTFELPELNVATEEPEPLPTLQPDIRSRPSFNRTPIGWVCSEDNSHIRTDLEIPFDGETDDL